ncbi:restriction endonuclease subunit S [Oryzomicrobium sp.]|uniref:restriction endonuclease subunit S n=1 Tax=Oryzomicrobium sp. TaxID=1911578 RepID=UPI0025EAA4DF|nr:restriction endonuclease subunit S [Oryzomicrobium sp.]MCE1242040.1 restriction endonuclease subunit S [Oryzomicrobium sp.]
MSRYKAYPAYKDSGVEWLGDIPAHWVATRLKRVISKLESGISVNATDVPAQNGDIGVLKTSCVYTHSFRPSENKAVFQDEIHRVKCPVRNGEIIISRMNTPDLVGASALVECETKNLYLPDRLWQTESLSLFPKFVAYFMMANGFRAQISLAAEGASSSMQNIAKENYLAIHAAHPISCLEQERISDFLDHETAKIDALIERQQRLIELLKEKRQAVISHAVTKGLNPNAPMKDSGLEWLGEVPKHWGVTKFHYEIDLLEGPGILANDFFDEGVPLLRIQNIKNHFVSDEFKTFLSPSKVSSKWEHFRVSRGDLIISCSASTGLVSEVGENVVGAVPYTGLIRLRPRRNALTKDFIRHLVQSDLFFEQIKLLQSGSTIQHFGPYHLHQMYITLPPISEQEEIARAIRHKTARLDELIVAGNDQIELIKERRTALISAAVTGKIDVRGWQPAAA